MSDPANTQNPARPSRDSHTSLLRQGNNASSKKRVAAPSRKTVCLRCSKKKVRCDLRRPSCSTCNTRGIRCVYEGSARGDSGGIVVELVGGNRDVGLEEEQRFFTGRGTQDSNNASPGTAAFESPDALLLRQQQLQEAHNLSALTHGQSPRQLGTGAPTGPDFTNIQLICTVDSSRIRNRWMGDFIPSLDQRLKTYSPSIIHFITRVFKTYPRMLLRKDGVPPFIHPLQLAGPDIPTPLANCVSLVRMWEGQVRGSEAIVQDTVKKEMERLFSERRSYDQMDLLAAFQAYLVYALIAFFCPGSGSALVDRQILINLQDFGSDLSNTGMVCPAEICHSRPDWESWIVAAAKRRSLFTMYTFDGLFCSLNGLPTFIAEELESLPAPASKLLWEASSRSVWEKEYNNFLSEWTGGGLRIDELWPVPDIGAAEQRKRVDHWLESVDVFGMMLFTVTLVTHGG